LVLVPVVWFLWSFNWFLVWLLQNSAGTKFQVEKGVQRAFSTRPTVVLCAQGEFSAVDVTNCGFIRGKWTPVTDNTVALKNFVFYILNICF